MIRKLQKFSKGRFITAKIKLEEGRLSITGEEGRLFTDRQARQEALQYWVSYFEDSPGEIQAMNARSARHFSTALGAARFVIQEDGEFHGLDLVGVAPNGRRMSLDSCGCLHEVLSKAFPKIRPLLPWHLNDLKAGCIHQKKLGWGNGHDVALSKDDLTLAQRSELALLASQEGDRLRKQATLRKLEELRGSPASRIAALKGLGLLPTMFEDEALELAIQKGGGFGKSLLKRIFDAVEAKISDPPIESQIFKDSIGAPCPECGYRYGTAWLTWELPPEIVKLALELVTGQI